MIVRAGFLMTITITSEKEIELSVMACWLRNCTRRGGGGDNSNRIGGDGWLGRGLEER
jgi:hypothetical protein